MPNDARRESGVQCGFRLKLKAGHHTHHIPTGSRF